jgi:uncharacterized protein GlcG (DUF336 family)
MDGAKFTSISIATSKAFTSAGHMTQTSKLPTPGNRSIENSNEGRFSLVQGGREVRLGGQVVGAVGISGAKPSEDDECARLAIEGWRGRSKL